MRRLSLLFLLALLGSSTASERPPYCEKCESHLSMVMSLVLPVFGIEIVSEEAADKIRSVCETYKLPEEFCEAAIKNILPHVVQFIDKANENMNPSEICSLLPGCDSPDSPQYSRNYRWKVELPPKPETIPEKKASSAPPLRVLQLADLHIDNQYTPGAEIDCLPESIPAFAKEFYQCCRGEPSEDPSNAAGFWGTTQGSCDIPFRTFESALKNLNQKGMEFDYILLTGDLIDHDIVNYSEDLVKNQLWNVTDTISWYFPETPIYFTPGNHEAVPVNAYSFGSEEEKVPQSWLYTEIENLISQWVPAEQRSSLHLHGSYIATPRPGFKIINLNNNFCYDLNFYSYLNPVDPGGVMQFLVDELSAAEQNGERVHIHAHIPPNSNCIQSWSDNYAAVVERFKETIVDQFHGHEHVEQHQIHFDEQGKPIAVNWVAPSLTGWSHGNPAFRTYVVNGSSFEVISSSIFHADVDNVGRQDKLEWKETDTAKEYGLEDFSPESWLKYMEKLEKDEEQRTKYARSVHRGSKWAEEECDDRCAQRLVCRNRNARKNSTACL